MSETARIAMTAQLEGGTYPIWIGRGVQEEVASYLSTITSDEKVLVVCDALFRDGQAQEIVSSLKRRGFKAWLHPVIGGKAQKNIHELLRIYEVMEQHEFARDSSLIALGGGVIGDMAGFAASSFLRGIHLIHIPTTVTSQIDSSIGGKVGINYGSTINAIGAYYHPEAVFIDFSFIDGLPDRDFVAGLAEIIKCAVICDAAFFSYLKDHAEQILYREEECLLHIYRRALEIKLKHVAGDLRDRNERLKLNYGHTIGHAVELATMNGEEIYRHGEGVALGMIGASLIADQLFQQRGAVLEQLRAILSRYGLPLSVNLKKVGLSKEEFVRRGLSSVAKDKKRQAMKIRFILPTEIGHALIYDQVPTAVVTQVVEMLCEEVVPVQR